MTKDQYELLHTNCPKCGSGKVKKSNKKVKANDEAYEDVINSASCEDCSWKGMVKNLVPSPELQSSTELEFAIPTGSVVAEDGSYSVWLEYTGLAQAVESYMQTSLEEVQFDTSAIDLIARSIKVNEVADVKIDNISLKGVSNLNNPQTTLNLITQMIATLEDGVEKTTEEYKKIINDAIYVTTYLALRATSPAKTVAVIKDSLRNIIALPVQKQYDNDVAIGKVIVKKNEDVINDTESATDTK